MKKGLIIANGQKTIDFLSQVFISCGYEPKTASELPTEIDKYSFILINIPIEKEVLLDLRPQIPVVYLVSLEHADKTWRMLEKTGIHIVPKPINALFLIEYIKLLKQNQKLQKTITQEKEKMQTEVANIKIIDRAKFLLIEYLKMSESQAHRYIEKQAMDLRQPKKVVAENIIKTYQM